MAYVVAPPTGGTLSFAQGITNGADTVIGSNTVDIIWAHGSDDFMKGGGGADFLDGGEGRDAVSYGDSTEGVVVDLQAGTGKGGTAQGDMIFRVEDVYGSQFGDTLIGDTHDNMLDGGDGHDVLKGGGGIDTLFGGNGDDVFQVDGLQDTIHGGAGIDTLTFTPHDEIGLHVDLQDGFIKPSWGPGMWKPPHSFVYGVENVIGTETHDKLAGDGVANKLMGGGGGDSLRGRGGNDVLEGGNGGDFLDGGAGADILRGGADADRFVFKEHVDSVWGGGTASMDVIMDFQKGQDKIDLTEMDPATGNLLILNSQNIDGVNCSVVGMDYDHDGTLEMYEFALMVKMAPGATLSAADVLI
jgi:Ca2+-binding RTX toxin-like protein